MVDIKQVGDGGNALKYLARYIYRVALTDSSITHHNDESVTFRYRKSGTGKSATMELPVFKFLHRFLQHVLPKGFVKVRYYGLHHPAYRQKLSLARAAIHMFLKRPLPPPLPPTEPRPALRCLACNTILIPGMRFKPGQLPPSQGPP